MWAAPHPSAKISNRDRQGTLSALASPGSEVLSVASRLGAAGWRWMGDRPKWSTLRSLLNNDRHSMGRPDRLPCVPADALLEAVAAAWFPIRAQSRSNGTGSLFSTWDNNIFIRPKNHGRIRSFISGLDQAK
jgi:hypothetical protein